MMWMELENIMLSEISQSEQDKNHTISLNMWNLGTKQKNHNMKRERWGEGGQETEY